jgi:hypothetical protein
MISRDNKDTLIHMFYQSMAVESITVEPINACPSYADHFNIRLVLNLFQTLKMLILSKNRSRSIIVLGTFSSSLLFYSITSHSIRLIQEQDLCKK